MWTGTWNGIQNRSTKVKFVALNLFLKLALVWLRELHKLMMVAVCSSEVPIRVNVENDLTPKSCEVDFLGPGHFHS